MEQLIKILTSLMSKIDQLLDTNSCESLYRISVSPQDIVVDNKTIRVRYNKLVVKNMSNYKVFLFGTYTLIPGESFVLGSEKNNDKMITDMNIFFDTTLFDATEPDVKRVEILQINRIGKEASFTDTPGQSDVNPIN